MAKHQKTQERIETLFELRLQGYKTSQLIEAGIQFWQVDKRTVQHYLAEVKILQQQSVDASLNEHFIAFLKRQDHLYIKAWQAENYTEARKINVDKVKMITTFKKKGMTGGLNATAVQNSFQTPKSGLAEFIAGMV